LSTTALVDELSGEVELRDVASVSHESAIDREFNEKAINEGELMAVDILVFEKRRVSSRDDITPTMIG